MPLNTPEHTHPSTTQHKKVQVIPRGDSGPMKQNDAWAAAKLLTTCLFGECNDLPSTQIACILAFCQFFPYTPVLSARRLPASWLRPTSSPIYSIHSSLLVTRCKMLPCPQLVRRDHTNTTQRGGNAASNEARQRVHTPRLGSSINYCWGTQNDQSLNAFF